jgi:hypothetical protein
MSTKPKSKKAVKVSKTAHAKKDKPTKASLLAARTTEAPPHPTVESAKDKAPPATKAIKATKERKPSKWWQVVDAELGLWKFIWKGSGMFHHVTKGEKGARVRRSLKTRDEAEARRIIAGERRPSDGVTG